MLGKLFGNPDVKAALSELDKALRGEHSMAFMMIAPRIKEAIKYKNGAIPASTRQRGHGQNITILSIAKRVLDAELPSGHHHIYRGVLSERGHFLLDLYIYVVHKLWEAEPGQEVSEEEEINFMKEAIAKVG